MKITSENVYQQIRKTYDLLSQHPMPEEMKRWHHLSSILMANNEETAIQASLFIGDMFLSVRCIDMTRPESDLLISYYLKRPQSASDMTTIMEPMPITDPKLLMLCEKFCNEAYLVMGIDEIVE